VKRLLLVIAVLSAQNVFAQKFSEAIEDNSFFVEEAYNQETRVVQHISTALFVHKPSHDFAYSFTQEWPAFGLSHQVSYTLSYLSLDRGTAVGLGDLMLNYRYQLAYTDDWAAISPRLSVILPTGSKEKGTGRGAYGVQGNLPMSKRLSEPFVAHFNLGFTTLINETATLPNGSEEKHSPVSVFTGGSVIWLAHEKFNLMLEYLYSANQSLGADGAVVTDRSHLVSPGIRYAIDTGSLQTVIGLAAPVVMAKDYTDVGVFLYLSFEHPY
jgi:hypothetical protein